MKYVFALLLLAGFSPLISQEESRNSFTAGLEQDILPYITGGYFAGIWAGKGHIRGRALLVRVHKPDFILPEGFTNNRTTAFALLGDYFLRNNWRGWWAGAGLVYWKNTIQTDAHLGTASFDQYLLNGSLGYNWKFWRNFYLSPWAGLHIQVAGDKEIPVDGKIFRPSLLNPEASLKLGWHF